MNVKISGEQLGFNPNSLLVLSSTIVLILEMLHHMLHLTGLSIVLGINCKKRGCCGTCLTTSSALKSLSMFSYLLCINVQCRGMKCIQ